MMTQKLWEAQDTTGLRSNEALRTTHASGETPMRGQAPDGASLFFDALEFELKREQIFNKTEKPYIQPNYEIDSDRDWCGCLYRVWNGRVLLGTFYQKQNRWLANPFYKNRQYIKLEQSLERRFNSNEKAINYIIRTFEGN